MEAGAPCCGAGTMVNGIAGGKGAAFGLAWRATATAETQPEPFGVRVDAVNGVDPKLAVSAARRVLERSGSGRGLAISVDSEIPISRGLKSSSVVANAVVLASARALAAELEPLEMFRIGVDAAVGAGVTLTGAFDDACASLFGGNVLTDNHARSILQRDPFSAHVVAVVHIPGRSIRKEHVN